jgi:hypothetical protein
MKYSGGSAGCIYRENIHACGLPGIDFENKVVVFSGGECVPRIVRGTCGSGGVVDLSSLISLSSTCFKKLSRVPVMAARGVFDEVQELESRSRFGSESVRTRVAYRFFMNQGSLARVSTVDKCADLRGLELVVHIFRLASTIVEQLGATERYIAGHYVVVRSLPSCPPNRRRVGVTRCRPWRLMSFRCLEWLL